MNCDTDTLDALGLPEFLQETEEILTWLKAKSESELKALWKCNDKILEENMKRLERLKSQQDLRKNLTPAVIAYDGIAYQYMAPAVFENEQLNYVQEHLRILSAFYGVLKAMDGVVPYRLEMQAKVDVAEGRNLYEFWGDKIYKAVRDESGIIINLASKEYFKCVEKYLRPEDRFITITFVEMAKDKDGKLYIKINATFDDNRTIELEYYGATTAVESLDGMTPAVVSNSYKLYNPDGSPLINQDISKVLFKQQNNIYTFYLYGGEFSNKFSSEKVTLQVDESFINAGTINLAELKDGDNFQVKYADVQLYSPDAKYMGYNNTPDNGTFSIKKDAAGNYEISLDVVNTYTNKNTPNGAGNKERLVFNYNGAVEAY